MKQMFSIFCALMIVLSASAAPAKALRPLKNQLRKEQVQKQKGTKAQQFGQRLTADKATATRDHSIYKAKKAPAEATDVEISDYAVTLYPEENIAFYGLYTEDWSKAFYFSIFIEEGKRDVELGKTYTLEDMEAETSEWDEQTVTSEWDDEGWRHYYSAATFTKTKGEGYATSIAATVTDQDGNEFVLSYKEEPIVLTGETIDIILSSKMHTIDRIDDGSWRLLGNDDVYTFQVNYYSDNEDSPVGDFKPEDMDLANCYLYIATDEIDEYGDPVTKRILFKDGSASTGEDDFTISVATTMTGDDGNIYRIAMSFDKPRAKYEASITADNLLIEDWAFETWGLVDLSASDENYSIVLTIRPEGLADQLSGTYNIGKKGCTGTIKPLEEDAEEVSIYSGSFELTYSNGNVTLKGTVLGMDDTEYTLDLKYINPEATREQDLSIEGLELGSIGMAWQALGYNADSTQFVSIAANAFDYAGQFTIADLDKEYTYVVTDIEGESYKFFAVVDADLNVTFDDDTKTATITGKLICQNTADETDIPQFNLNLKATEPDPLERDKEADFDATLPTYEINKNYLEDYGTIYVDARDGETVVALEFWVADGADDIVAGTYPINATFEPQTVSASRGMSFGGNLYYSFVGYADETNTFSDVWFLTEGEVVVDENGVITVNGKNSKGKTVHAVLGITSGVEQLENKTAARKRIENNQLIIERQGVKYNALGTVVK